MAKPPLEYVIMSNILLALAMFSIFVMLNWVINGGYDKWIDKFMYKAKRDFKRGRIKDPLLLWILEEE